MRPFVFAQIELGARQGNYRARADMSNPEIAATYYEQLNRQMSKVFETLPKERDHRKKYPWLTGYLGDPLSGIWFLAENPSLKRVEQIVKRPHFKPVLDAQWSESPGDKLFRDMLVKYDFKRGKPMELGGWRCYITDVIKETDYVKRFHDKSQSERNSVAESWAPVLRWELENSRPKLIVVMGRQTEKFLKRLSMTFSGIKLPTTLYIDHYAYIGSYAKGSLGPMDPSRVQQYDRDFQRIAEVFQKIRV